MKRYRVELMIPHEEIVEAPDIMVASDMAKKLADTTPPATVKSVEEIEQALDFDIDPALYKDPAT